MAQSMLVMSRQINKLESLLKQKAYSFLEKLTTDDSLPGLHIEPMRNPADNRVRTGRVDQKYRAVLFRLSSGSTPTYVFYGIWNHDEAIDIACRTRLELNPVNGIAEIRLVEPSAEPSFPSTPPLVEQPRLAQEALAPSPAAPLIDASADDLVQRLGMAAAVAARALTISDPDELLDFADSLADWQGMALVDLGSGESIESVRETLDMETPQSSGPATDDQLLGYLEKPSSQAQFAKIEGVDELRRVIESGDFGGWRVFLHPEQRKWATKDWNGPFRLSGGAGTGKTVVVLHRARNLARLNPKACIVVTTFTVNLAKALDEDLLRLDPTLLRAKALGEPGIYIAGIDSIAWSVLSDAGETISEATANVLGSALTDVSRRDDGKERWRNAVDSAGSDLRSELRSTAFFASEYQLVILANDVNSGETYLRVRRPGRGTRLSRSDRAAVWQVVERYRAAGRSEAKLNYPEAASVAAEVLNLQAVGGRQADHVLVDEGQDLSPSHWKLVRALVEPGANDVFIAEDSHQRIYGHRLVLSRFGFETRGRARRLTLNYRTTAQNLAWAVGVLEGATSLTSTTKQTPRRATARPDTGSSP